MSRSYGVDVKNYRYCYEVDYTSGIPDIGFRALIDIYNYFGIPLELFFLSVGITFLVSLYKLSRFYKVSYMLVLFLYLLHLVVVRDFAQLRVSLAISLIFFGIPCKNRFFKYAFYCLGVSMQMSSIIFVFIYPFSRFINNLHNNFLKLSIILSSSLIIFIIGDNIHLLGFIDSRIDLYISWKADNYGNEVSHYNHVILHSTLIIMYFLISSKCRVSDQFQTLFILEVFSIIVFFAFSKYAIFAFRLSNIVSSLYPFFIIYIFSGCKLRFRKNQCYKFIIPIIFLLICLSLLMRPGSYAVIRKIDFLI